MDMGKAMSTASVYLKQAFYRYNASSRALKYIEKEKLPLAPRHENTERLIEVEKGNAAVFERLMKKDKNLDEYLKTVYLTSTGENKEIKAKRSLPQNRSSRDEYSFKEPEVIPKGSCLLTNVVKFLDDHKTDPELWSATKIAKDYELDKNKVEIILKYHGTFFLANADKANEEEEDIVSFGQDLMSKMKQFSELEPKPFFPKKEDEASPEEQNQQLPRIESKEPADTKSEELQDGKPKARSANK